MTECELLTISRKTAELIARFASEEGLLSQSDLAILFGTTLDSRLFRYIMDDPEFPKPVFLTARTRRWKTEDVKKFIDSRRRG